MKHFPWILCLLLPCLAARSLQPSGHPKEKWVTLFNGRNLTGWDSYIAPGKQDGGDGKTIVTGGLNNDAKKVFSVVQQDGHGVIRVSGEQWGGLSTLQKYDNFHLQLQFKWGELTWGQKKGKKKDSGLLYFAVGKHGADGNAWMRSQEFQIQEGDCGDYWGVAGAGEEVPAHKKSDSEYVYDPSGQRYLFSATSTSGRHCIKRGEPENPTGQWNTLDLYCHGDTSIHVVNGKVVMVLYHSQQMDNGQSTPLAKGKLQLQSEGAEVFYRDIRITAISQLPPGMQ